MEWGVEFLDLEDYRPPQILLSHEKVIHIPTVIVASMVDSSYIGSIVWKNRDKIGNLQASMARQGQLEPIVISYNGSKVKLMDGNHRFLAAQAGSMPSMRARLLEVENNIPRGGIPMQRFVRDILSNIGEL